METFYLKDGATIDYSPTYLNPEFADELFSELLQLKFEQPILKMWGKDIPIPRFQAWMSSPHITNKDAALYQKGEPLPWSDNILKLKKPLENLYATTFDYLLINYYPTGRQYISYHSDSEHDDGSTIVSISLGGTRRFLLRNIADRKLKMEFQLAHGDLIVMRDNTQKSWQHSIPRTAKDVKPRINLTFRNIK